MNCKRAYFFCVEPREPDNSPYCHASVALAEGFVELGIEVYGNVPYWPTTADQSTWLIPHTAEITPSDCDVVIIDSNHGYFGAPIPKELTDPARTFRSVYIDFLDGAVTKTWDPELRGFDLVLKAQANGRTQLPSNATPWAYGLTKRIIRATEGAKPVSQRNPVVLANFRIPHPLRAEALQAISGLLPSPLRLDTTVDAFDAEPTDPLDHLQWHHTGRRHYPTYYERLRNTAAVAAFGGMGFPPFPVDHTRSPNYVDRLRNKLAASKIGPPRRVLQWDSWRFWESLAAGCVTLHVDFERYGIALPEMPVKGVHYVGVDLENPAPAFEAIRDTAAMDQLGANGRNWALTHFGPTPTAKRLLRRLGMTAGS